jgi:hypothetical protein
MLSHILSPLAARARPRRVAETPPGSGTVILHIGRNKAGSTSIQDFCLEHRAELLRQGVDYVLFGHVADSQPGAPGFAGFGELADYIRGDPGPRRLVSNEFMFGWPDAFTDSAAADLAGLDVQVLAYLRPYDDWLVSAYAEETRRGMNMRDIDAYADWLAPRISAWPHLRKWGECFGWDRLQIRVFSRRTLLGGDLLSDFFEAAALQPIPHAMRARNVSPHWIELELMRSLAERNGETEWSGVSPAVAVPLADALRPLLGRAPPAAYLTLAQRRRLVELYNQDLARIAEAGGPRLPAAPPPAGEERAFVPALDQAPRDLLAAFFEQVGATSFAQAHPEAARRARALAATCGLGASADAA